MCDTARDNAALPNRRQFQPSGPETPQMGNLLPGKGVGGGAGRAFAPTRTAIEESLI
jgi:hypothetical protein